MILRTITISISDDQDWTDAQDEEVFDLLEEWLDHIRFEHQAQETVNKAKLSQGIKIKVDY